MNCSIYKLFLPQLEEMLPTNLAAIVNRSQSEEYARVEAMLGSLAQVLCLYAL